VRLTDAAWEARPLTSLLTGDNRGGRSGSHAGSRALRSHGRNHGHSHDRSRDKPRRLKPIRLRRNSRASRCSLLLGRAERRPQPRGGRARGHGQQQPEPEPLLRRCSEDRCKPMREGTVSYETSCVPFRTSLESRNLLLSLGIMNANARELLRKCYVVARGLKLRSRWRNLQCAVLRDVVPCTGTNGFARATVGK
jgi:hypothetical protein